VNVGRKGKALSCKKDMRRTNGMQEIRWAVLGTGVIANEMAAALKKNGKNIYCGLPTNF